MLEVPAWVRDGNDGLRAVRWRRASCEVVDRRFETQGPAPIYKLVTLLWLNGHRGPRFEVWDDLSGVV